MNKLVLVLLILTPLTGNASIHVNVEDIQESMFPNQNLMLTPITLSDASRDKMKDASGVREPFKTEHIWHSDKGEWLVVDEVVGKHEMIKYAVGINSDGSVKQVRVMDYVESYGYEVAENKWLQQKPPAGPNEFRLVCAENLPSQPYLPGSELLSNR